MASFLVDEDMPRSTRDVLRRAGHDAADVRDLGLRGHSDIDVFDYAQLHALTVITEDRGFGDVLATRPEPHFGIIVLRVPNEISTYRTNEILMQGLDEVVRLDLSGLIVVIEPSRVRIRATETSADG